MKLIHFSDIHLTTPPEIIYGRDPNVNFATGLKHCLSLHSDAAALIITGDLTEHGELENYQHLKTIVDTLRMPVYLTIGNHDNRDNFAEVFPEHTDENGFAQRVFKLPKGTGIMLDTRNLDYHWGELCKTRLDWLSNQLQILEGPIWIFMHHHPIRTHLERMDYFMLRDHEAFGDVVAPHRDKIAHIFFGHIHLPTFGSMRGIPVSATRGPNHNGWPDYWESRVARGADVLEAYTVVFADKGSTTVQMVEFGCKGQDRKPLTKK